MENAAGPEFTSAEVIWESGYISCASVKLLT